VVAGFSGGLGHCAVAVTSIPDAGLHEAMTRAGWRRGGRGRQLANVCNSEVALIRSFMRKALAQYHRLETAETAAAARASANAAANVARQRAEVAAQQQAARAAAAAAAQQR
jgi:hypothetical protein